MTLGAFSCTGASAGRIEYSDSLLDFPIGRSPRLLIGRQMERLFFSYSRADKDFVLRLAKDLRSAGVNLWIDQLDIAPGDRWDRAVEEALAAAPCLLVVLSPVFLCFAKCHGRGVARVRREKENHPMLTRQCNVPFRLRRLQYVDFTTGYDVGLAALVGALKSQVQAGREPQRLQTTQRRSPTKDQAVLRNPRSALCALT